jgi:16S rRNA (adenine1518-N6/adenine1519-N6)-dimethyltransferase
VQTLSEIRQLLAERGLKPKHRLGQNFLHDKNQIAKLVDAAQIKPGDLVLEVGPGTGTLTEALLEHGAEVVACELDQDLAAIIEDRFAACLMPQAASPKPLLTLVRGDALAKQRQLNPDILQLIANRAFKLVANLPYQIASPLISTLLIDHPNCAGQCVTIQKEVADRLIAKPSTKEYGSLSIIVQALAEVSRIGTLGPSCFWPPPEVTSVMVAIVPKGEQRTLVTSEAKRDFARFVIELFTKRRKQLGTIFGRSRLDWPPPQFGISPDLRPEALTVEQLIQLWRTFGGAQTRSQP